MSRKSKTGDLYGLSEMTCRKYGPQEDGSYRMKAWQSTRSGERQKGATRFRVRAIYRASVLLPCSGCDLQGLPVEQCTATAIDNYTEGTVTVVESRWESRRPGFALSWEALELCNLMVYVQDNPQFSQWFTLVEMSVRRGQTDKNPYGLAHHPSRCPHPNNRKKAGKGNPYGI